MSLQPVPQFISIRKVYAGHSKWDLDPAVDNQQVFCKAKDDLTNMQAHEKCYPRFASKSFWLRSPIEAGSLASVLPSKSICLASYLRRR